MSSRKIIVITGMVLLLVHLILRWHGGKHVEGIDPVGLSLALVALSPWLARLIESAKVGGMEVKFVAVAQQVEKQRAEIETLTFLISHFLSRDALNILIRLSSNKNEVYEIDVGIFPEEFKADLRHLRGLGFITNYEGKGIREMYKPQQSPKRNVHDYFTVTESGHTFLRLRGAAGV